jgi:(2Fe-2S) ferredoxin
MHFLSKKIYFMKIDSPPKPTISPYKHYVLMCTGPRCGEEGAGQALYDSLWPKLKAAGIHEGSGRTKFNSVDCFGACKGGPVMCVQPHGTWYYNVTPTNLDRIISEHLVGDQAVQDLVFYHSPQVDVPAQRSVLS